MKLLVKFDDNNYDSNWSRFERIAVRGIIIKNNKIALVKSEKEGFYKFPGGGIENGESHLETLVRETKEESGLIIVCDSIKEFGMIHEIRKSKTNVNEIFDQKSYYYFVDVENELTDQNLDHYEIELGFTLEWTDIRHAYEINSKLGKNYESKFLLREAQVLKLLMNSN